VIDLRKNIEAPVLVEDKLAYLENPELLRHIPQDEVIGIGSGGEEYTKGPDLPPLGDDLDPAVREIIQAPPLRPGLVVGRELAKTLHVYVGDEITLVSPLGDLGPMGVMPRTKKFRIAAIFFSGMYEYDASKVYTTMDVAQDYFEMKGKISAIDVKVEDAENAELLTSTVTDAVARPELRVRDWRDINKNLFSALKLERIATFIILSIAIMVASFCIVSTLLLMITEKAKEIAILKAIGARDGAILRTFMVEGIIIGGIGTIFGVGTALAACTGLSWFGVRLDPEVYYIDRLPVNVNAGDYAMVAVAAMIICTVSTIYPAFAASELRPVDGLRWE
jgi:lipoprotein-releasing system permease protein